jgi:GxxExxY protein
VVKKRKAGRAMDRKPLPPELNHLSGRVVHAAYVVHETLGPGLLESVYEVCLAHELGKAGLRVERQVPLPVIYDELKLDAGFRLDLLVERRVVIELKAVEGLLPVHQAQVLTYLKLSGFRLGLLINFNVPVLKEGIRRVVL